MRCAFFPGIYQTRIVFLFQERSRRALFCGVQKTKGNYPGVWLSVCSENFQVESSQ